MPSQDELLEYYEYPLYEAEFREGTVKTRNKTTGEVQRPVLTDRGDDDRYKVCVRLISCVHGYLDSSVTKPSPASLIIFEYQLRCLEEKHNFSSVLTTFEFTEGSPELQRVPIDPANPNVIAYAPFFETLERWNSSNGSKQKGLSWTGDIGVNTPIVIMKVGLARDTHSNSDKRYFTEGYGGRHSDKKGNHNKVWWYLRQNPALEDGVPPVFQLAMLLSRSSDSVFKGNFYVEVKGCFHYHVSKALDRFLRRSDIIDDPINFDPKADPIGQPTDVDRDRLGDLKIGNRLRSLTGIWGLDPVPMIECAGLSGAM